MMSTQNTAKIEESAKRMNHSKENAVGQETAEAEAAEETTDPGEGAGRAGEGPGQGPGQTAGEDIMIKNTTEEEADLLVMEIEKKIEIEIGEKEMIETIVLTEVEITKGVIEMIEREIERGTEIGREKEIEVIEGREMIVIEKETTIKEREGEILMIEMEMVMVEKKLKASVDRS